MKNLHSLSRTVGRGLYTAMLFLATAPAAFAYSFSSGGTSVGGMGGSAFQPGGGTNVNGIIQNADTTVLLVKGLAIDAFTLGGIVIAGMGIYRITKDKERGENHHAAALKMILAGGAMASLGVFMMTIVNGIYT